MRFFMRRALILGLVVLGFAACTSGGQKSLRDGLLRPDIGQKAFRSEWGQPDEIVPVLSEATVAQRWGQSVDLLRNADPDDHPQLWVYRAHQTDLLFLSGDLVAWKTGLTREQLRAIPAGRR
jgi:hypothetical protein